MGKEDKIINLENFYILNDINTPRRKNYVLNLIKNTINILSQKGDKVSIEYYVDSSSSMNNEIAKTISIRYDDIGFKVTSYKIVDDRLYINLKIPKTFKKKALDFTDKILNDRKYKVETSKLENIIMYKIYERDDLQLAGGKNIMLSHKDLDLGDVGGELLYVLEEERNKTYFITDEDHDLLDIILLRLLLKGYLDSIIQADKTIQLKGNADYIVTISKDFSKGNVLNKFKKHFDLGGTIRSVKVSLKNDEYIIEKEHVFIGDELEKYVDLIKRFPHSEIINNTYYGKTNRYVVKEKIKISKLENDK